MTEREELGVWEGLESASACGVTQRGAGREEREEAYERGSDQVRDNRNEMDVAR